MASAAQIGALRVTLGLNTAEFEKGAKRAVRQTGQLNKSFTGLRGNIAGLGKSMAGLGALVAGAFSVQAVKGALDYAASLGEVSAAAGVTVEQLQVYRQLATQVNLTTEQMDKSLGKLTLSLGKAALGSKAEKDALEGLNISLKDGEGNVRSTNEVLLDLADRISKIQDPAKQAAAAYALFGRQGQKLIPMLKLGREGLEEFARRAEASGSIIGEDLSNAADRAADKMALLNEQLKARFAAVVAQNAGAILTFANALGVAVTQISRFISQYGRLLAVAGGAAIGGRLAGVPGALVGGAAGIVGGGALSRGAADANTVIEFRRAELERARQRLAKLQSLGRGIGDPRSGPSKAAVAELRKQTALTRAAIAENNRLKAITKPDGEFDPDEFLDTSGGGGGKSKGSGKSAAEIAAEAAKNAARFADDVGRLRIDQLQAEQEYTGNIMQRRDVALAALDEEMASFERNLALDADLTETQKQELREKQQALIDQRKRNEEQQYGIDLANQQNELARAGLQLELEQAGLRAEMADNSRDRLAAELDIFELQERLKIAELDRILAVEATASAAWQNAKAEKEFLEATRALREAAVARQNQTPGQKFTESLNLKGGALQDAMDEIKINGLNTLNDGLVDAIVNFRSLGDVARSVIRQILSDLLTLQIRKSIIGPLSQALGLAAGAAIGGANHGGGGGDIIGSIISGARAGGGPVLKNRTYLVGERGRELFVPDQDGQIVANDQFGGRNVTHSPTFVFPGITDARGAREAAGQAARRYRTELTPMRGM